MRCVQAGRRMDIFAPSFAHLPEGNEAQKIETFERAAVIKSLEDLITYPFVDQAMNESRLEIHGAVTHIDDGGLEVYDAADRAFAPI